MLLKGVVAFGMIEAFILIVGLACRMVEPKGAFIYAHAAIWIIILLFVALFYGACFLLS